MAKKNLQQCVDYLAFIGELNFCNYRNMEFPKDKIIQGFITSDDEVMNDKIKIVYQDTQYERSTCVVFIGQKDQISDEFWRELRGQPCVVLGVSNIAHATHELGNFIAGNRE